MSTVVITGANRGLGLALVEAFAKEGWSVIAACRDPHNFPKSSKTEKIKVVPLDVSDQNSLDSFCEGAEVVDVLINNAAIFDNKTDGAPVFTESRDITPIFVTNSMAPRMLSDRLSQNIERGENKLIVTISSNMGLHAQNDDYNAKHWPYSASKAAVNFAMDGFAFLHPNIRSVLVDPGWMKTRLGGDDAPIEPADSAQRIIELFVKSSTLKSGKLYDLKGEVQEW